MAVTIIFKRRPAGMGITRRESESVPGTVRTVVREWQRLGYNYLGEFDSGDDIRLSDGEFAVVKKL
jgi:hypothetical protein